MFDFLYLMLLLCLKFLIAFKCILTFECFIFLSRLIETRLFFRVQNWQQLILAAVNF